MAAVIGALRVNLGLNSAEFEQGMKKAQGALGGISKAFAALGGVALFAGFTTGIGAAVGRIEEMRKLTSQLDKALENTGNTANTSASEVEQFADRLERATGRAAEEVVAVSTNLATFGFSREVFYDAIKLADDMSAAWGGDLRQNAEGLARALADPEKGLAMLTKRGITFTDQQKDMIAGFLKANDLIGAQGVVMDALNEQVKGVAEAGFGGITKAQANATLALETFFETIANSLGVNAGLEMSLVAVAAALDFVTANIDVLAKGAAVAGSAIAVALGPSVWAAVSSAAVAMSATVVGAIRAIGVAIAANPIGLLITALAAAVTAAFVFRDEIKQAIGIDFVGIVKGAANNTIGLFVGAYKAVTAAWGLLPAAFGDIFTRAMNDSIEIVQGGVNGIIGALRSIPGLDGLADADLSGFMGEESGALGNLGAAVQDAFQEGFSQDYLGQLANMLGGVGEQAATATTQITGFGNSLDGGGSGGGAAGSAKAASAALKELADAGVAVWEKTRTPAENYSREIERLNMLLQKGAIDQDTYNRAVLQAQDAFKQAEMSGNQLATSLSSGLANVFSSVIDGSKSAVNAVGDLLKSLGSLLINQAFQGLLGGFFGGGGFGGFKLPSFDGGGYTGPGRGPGLDGKGGFLALLHPNETVLDHSKGQGMGPTIQISITGSQQDAAAIAREVRRVIPDAIQSYNRNPMRRPS